jgi:predicted nucleic acid-binding protein
MTFLLDSNILLHYIRQNAVTALIEAQFQPFQDNNPPLTSVVCIGEIRSTAIQNSWGAKKLLAMESFFAQLLKADINTDRIIRRYAEIDAFSQNKLPNRPLGLTARNMGKNDLWIAATASVLDLKLLTTDSDFDHLNEIFLEVNRVQI